MRRYSRTDWRALFFFSFFMTVFFPPDPKPFLVEGLITLACFAGGWAFSHLLIYRDRAKQDKTMREIVTFLRKKAFDTDAAIYGLVQGAVEVMDGVPVQERDPRMSDHMDMQLRLAASEFDTDPAYKKEWSPRYG